MKKSVMDPAAVNLYSRTRKMAGLALRDFLRCGMAGWCLEILFTSVSGDARGSETYGNHIGLSCFLFMEQERCCPGSQSGVTGGWMSLQDLKKPIRINCPRQS